MDSKISSSLHWEKYVSYKHYVFISHYNPNKLEIFFNSSLTRMGNWAPVIILLTWHNTSGNVLINRDFNYYSLNIYFLVQIFFFSTSTIFIENRNRFIVELQYRHQHKYISKAKYQIQFLMQMPILKNQQALDKQINAFTASQ